MAKSSTAGARDQRVDAYIANAAPFAKPILTHFRDVVHDACPEVVETLKWGHPSFEYHGIMCGISAFKEHCAFGFWKAALLDGIEIRQQVRSIDDLPKRRDLVRLVRQAARLNEHGIKVPEEPRKRAAEKPELTIPAVLAAALRLDKKAAAAFDAFSYSHKKEYVEWIDEAKTDDTRERRVETALEWMAEGKPRNWKYMKK
jgi:uncharacterized protein YdeI (YjbR/CyaY-like superfamily)